MTPGTLVSSVHAAKSSEAPTFRRPAPDLVLAVANQPTMTRKLKHHEQKLLRKVRQTLRVAVQ
jgi:hypothetical protein